MKTKIYKNYLDFLSRENKDENGVSELFAKEHSDYEKMNKSNDGCWNCSDCSGCSRCSDCSGCSRCSDCSGCSRCSDCSGCSRCSDCSGCSRCSGLKNAYPVENPQEENTEEIKIGRVKVPVIKNIHQTILEAINDKRNALNMADWHTCDTTHCRAGWVCHLAGTEGKLLEQKTSTAFAAQQIYKASSKIEVAPPRFYETNEVAMADIIKCAELEKGTI